MRILAVSDLRVQPFETLCQIVERHQPDLLLYAGDDVERFGTIPREVVLAAAGRCLEFAGGRTGSIRFPDAPKGQAQITPWPPVPKDSPQVPPGSGRRIQLGLHQWRILAIPEDFNGRQAQTQQEIEALLFKRRVRQIRRRLVEWDYTPEEIEEKLQRMKPPELHPLRVRGKPWFLHIAQQRRTKCVGDWSEIAATLPYGLVGVLGNDCHPLHRAILERPGCRDLESAPLFLDDWAFLGLGGAPVDEAQGIGLYLYDRRQAHGHLHRQLQQAGDRRCVLVSHTPPRGVLDLALRFGIEEVGSSVVRARLDDPRMRIVICGHVHSQGGRAQRVGDCLVINIASHDHEDAPLRYALLDIEGDTIEYQLLEERLYGDITRVRGIGPKTGRQLKERGLHTIADVLEADPAVLADCMGPARAQKAILHAKSLDDGRPRPLTPRSTFPSKAIFVDVETSCDNQDDPWLVAVMVRGTEQLVQLEELGTTDLRAHLQRLDKLLSRYSDHTFVQWTAFDRGALCKAFAANQLPEPAWLAPARWLDAHAWMRRSLILPVESTGLKPIAKYFDYTLRHPSLDGLTVGIWYARWRDEEQPFDVERVREYNADDVLALEHIIDGIEQLIASDGGGATRPG